MKKFHGTFSIIGILALVLAAGAAWAQPGMGPGGGRGRSMGGGLAYNRMYDPKTVETVSGEVLSVDRTPFGRRGAMGVHLTLKTDKETIPVHLGPARYVDQQGITLAAKDQIEVTGSRVTFRGKPAIIAREVKKGGQVLTLRDAAGVPAWAGQRRQ
jgi:hypothetical protein